ncbi:MAG: hypothetical protein ACE5HC_03270 [Candidatus Binatia bacterium]
MQESNKITTNLGEALLAAMREAVRGEIQNLMRTGMKKKTIVYSQRRKALRCWLYRRIGFVARQGSFPNHTF